ncbi:hypothetical protein BH23GEM3_BH23GEM3_11520 [soil metagenome]
MQPVPRSPFLLHSDLKFQARTREAASKAFVVEVVASWNALHTALQTSGLVSLAIVDPYAEHGVQSGPAPELRALLGAFPSTTVVAAVMARSRLQDLRTLGEWSVAQVIVIEEEDAAAIRRLLQAVRGRPLQSVLERSLPEKVSGSAREILSAAAEVATAGGQVEELARYLYTSMRTLHRRCGAAGLPPPRQTLAWMRILLAAELLEQPGRSIESVAAACGYASDSGLRRTFYDFLGMSPKELRGTGALATTSSAFRKKLSEVAAAPGRGARLV